MLMMRFALTLAVILVARNAPTPESPKPAVVAPPTTVSPFFAKQPWQGGQCWGAETAMWPGRIRQTIVYDYVKSGSKLTTETTIPALADGEQLLGKECHADATLVFTDQNVFVFPGGRSLLLDPVEDRTYVPYHFDVPLLRFVYLGDLRFVALFADGTVFSGQVLVQQQDINWTLLGHVRRVSAVRGIVVDGMYINVEHVEGSTERFEVAPATAPAPTRRQSP